MPTRRRSNAKSANSPLERLLRDEDVLASFLAIKSLDKRRREYKKVGWLYVARNESFVDPVFKVGESSRPPVVRVGELSGSTSVYRDFELVYFVHVTPRDAAEAWVHEALRDFRVNPRKEFFEAPLPVVIQALDRAAEAFPIPRGKTRRAGFLKQPLQPRRAFCPYCGEENRIPGVLAKIRITCGACSREIATKGVERKLR